MIAALLLRFTGARHMPQRRVGLWHAAPDPLRVPAHTQGSPGSTMSSSDGRECCSGGGFGAPPLDRDPILPRAHDLGVDAFGASGSRTAATSGAAPRAPSAPARGSTTCSGASPASPARPEADPDRGTERESCSGSSSKRLLTPGRSGAAFGPVAAAADAERPAAEADPVAAAMAVREVGGRFGGRGRCRDWGAGAGAVELGASGSTRRYSSTQLVGAAAWEAAACAAAGANASSIHEELLVAGRAAWGQDGGQGRGGIEALRGQLVLGFKTLQYECVQDCRFVRHREVQVSSGQRRATQ